MSYRTLSAKPLNVSLKTLLKRGGHIGLGLSAFTPVLALANPTGGAVVSGQATIANPSANGTIITQRSNSAIINWQQFNIGAGQFVQFLQPSSSSVVLNRVIGGSPSSILGSLTANGQVFLVNTNGVYFGKGSSIDTQGFLASTLGITDQNFLAHNYVFDQPGASGATVINDGSITSHHGGYVVLAGDYAENDGLISAQSGHVVLASGSKATLALNGNNLVNFAVNQSTLASYAGVKNTGSILADGGTVIMTADVANLLKSTVVNNTGLVEAHAISKDGGVIQLLASGGNISNAGTLDASATRKGQQGGDVTLKGDARTILTNTSNIDTLGENANGGSVEVSGETVGVRGALSVGRHGHFLLDPETITLTSGDTASTGTPSNHNSTSKIGIKRIEAMLGSQASVTISAHSYMNASSRAKSLTNTGAGNLILKAGQGIEIGGLDIAIGGKLTVDMGYGSFGHLQAASIELNASHSYVHLAPAVVNKKGVITEYSVKATTGDITMGGGATFTNRSGPGSTTATVALSAAGDIDLSGSYSGGSGFGRGNLTLIAGKALDVTGIIDISGALTAAASDGDVDFRIIDTLKDVSITAKSGGIVTSLINITAGGAVSLKASGPASISSIIDLRGNVSIDASNLIAKDITTHGNITVKGGLVQLASNGGLFGVLLAYSGSINLTGDIIGGAVPLKLTADKGITVNGEFGSSHGGSVSEGLVLQAGGAIHLDHGIKLKAPVSITGSELVYTGTGASFDISAKGGLILDAAIGTAKTPVKYSVVLTDTVSPLDVQRSIFTAGSISIAEFGGLRNTAGVFVGNNVNTAITLSAKGPISISGTQVAIGYTGVAGSSLHTLVGAGIAPIVISADDGNSKNTTINLSIIDNALSTAANGGVHVRAYTAPSSSFVVDSNDAKQTLDGSITLHAGHDVIIEDTLTGGVVDLSGGRVAAAVMDHGGSFNVKDGLTITAGHDIAISAQALNINGGFARGNAEGGTKTETLNVQSGVSLDAGHDIQIAAYGGNLSIHGGNAYGAATVSGSAVAKEKVSTTVLATVSLTAGTDIVLTAADGKLTVAAGASVGTGSGAMAEAAGAVVNVALHADVSLAAGDGMTLKSKGDLTLQGGSHAGAGFESYYSGGTNGTGTRLFQEQVFADGKGATATVTDTADLSISTGKGGLSASASTGQLIIHGGDSAAAGAIVSATAAGAKASLTAQSAVNIVDKGALTLHDFAGVTVRGGNGAARAQSSSRAGTSSTAFSHVKPANLQGAADAIMGLIVDSGVTITATGNVDVTGVALTLAAGSQRDQSLQVHVDSSGATGLTQVAIHTGLVISGAGFISLKGKSVSVDGGVNALGMASIVAHAGTVKLSDSDSVVIGGTKGLSISASHSALVIQGGNDAADHTHVETSNGGKIAATVGTGVSLSATGGAMTLVGTNIDIDAGSGQASQAQVDASFGGSAALTVDSAIGIAAHGKLTIDVIGVATHLDINGGHSAVSAQAIAKDGGLKASLVTAGSIAIVAGSASLVAGQGNISIKAGFASTSGSSTKVSAAAGGAASLKQTNSVSIAVAGDLSVLALGTAALHAIGGSAGKLVEVQADGVRAAATFVDDGSLSIKAGDNMLISAGLGKLDVTGVDASLGNSAFVGGKQHGKASLTVDAAINLTAGKAMVLGNSGSGLALTVGSGAAAVSADASADHGGSARLNIDDSINVKGGSVTLKGHGITLQAGESAAQDAIVSAGSTAKSSLSVNRSLDITATTAFSAHLTGAAASHDFLIQAGSDAADQTKTQAVDGGVAKLSAVADLTINVTGKGGTLTLAAGTGASDLFFIGGGAGAADEGQVIAGTHATATLSAESQIDISAKGAIQISAPKGELDIHAQDAVARMADASASSFAAVASITAGGGVQISGGAITVSVPHGSLAISAGASAGREESINASNQGTATVSADAGMSLTATGALSISEDADLTLTGGNTAGAGVFVTSRFRGKAAGTFTANTTLSAGTLSITASNAVSSHFVAHAGASVGGAGSVDAGSSAASAKLTAEGNLTLKAGGVLSILTHAVASHALGMFAGQKLGTNEGASAEGAKSVANVIEQASLTVSAGSTLSFDMAGSLAISAAGRVGSAETIDGSGGGNAAISTNGRVNISAGKDLSIDALGATLTVGSSQGKTIKTITHGGTANATVISGIGIKAGATLTVDALGHDLSIETKANDGFSDQLFTRFPLSTSKVSLTDSITLKAKAALDLTSIASLDLTTGAPGAVVLAPGGGSKVTESIDDSINLMGKSLVTDAVVVNRNPATPVISTGLTENTGINLVAKGGGFVGFSSAPSPLGTVQQDALIMSLEPLLSAPQGAATPAVLFAPQAGSLNFGSGDCQALLLHGTGSCRTDR